MRLRLTVLDAATSPTWSRELVVEAPDGTLFGRIRPTLVSAAPDASFSIGGDLVPDSAKFGAAPLLRGAVLTTGEPLPRDGVTSPGLVQLRVVSGPGAGRTVRLMRGDHVVGRAPSSDVRLDDAGVSRAHAVVSVGPDGVKVRDLVPTNPSAIDGHSLGTDSVRLAPTTRWRVGSTTLMLGGPTPSSGHHRIADGLVHVHRRPRFVEPGAQIEIAFPDAPRRASRARMPLLTSLAPLALSGVLALVLSSPAMLLFALMSPLLLLGQWWSDSRSGRKSHRQEVREHLQDVERARVSLAAAAAHEAARRRAEQPDLPHVADVVRHQSPELWQRRPRDRDHLVLRVGTARLPAAVTCTGGSADPSPVLDEVPFAIELEDLRVVGLSGPREETVSLAGALVAQLVAWHSPCFVRVHVLVARAPSAADWHWTTYLPHCADPSGDPAYVPHVGEKELVDTVGRLQSLVDAREPNHHHGQRIPADTLVVLDGAGELRSVPGVAHLLQQGPDRGVALICLDRDRDALPAEVAAAITLDESGARAAMHSAMGTVDDIAPDLPLPGWLRDFGRLAAPLVDATPDTGQSRAPDHVSFCEVHASDGIDVTSDEGLARLWASPTGPVAILGRDGDGPVEADLSRDGPHVLVAGTTGSGKSELLQTLVVGLAVRTRPDDLGFVLVDYKGGATFGECADLPHVLGVVTDLDERLTKRALTSLEAELKRRERLLAEAGVRDFAGYIGQRAVCRRRVPLARLVIVVDEFKVLAEELPDFVTGLVRIATVGRSLGVHLVLATQRPAGIVSADMRANISLRIALRVNDRAESSDVIDSDAAAAISDRTPGHALIRAADGRLIEFQTAHLGDAAPDEANEELVRVREVDARGREIDVRGSRALPERPSELAVVVAAVRGASRLLGVTEPESPWLPALPDELSIRGLGVVGHTDELSVPLGRFDDPARQAQGVHSWIPGRGSLGVVGGPRSGRSTALVSIALGLAERHPVDDVHIHVLEAGRGPLGELARLPHVGSIAPAEDPALVRRVISRLREGLDGERPAHTVVLVDGWEAIEEALRDIDHGAALDELLGLVRDGLRSGVHFAITGGRALVSGRLPGLLPHRLVLQLPDPVDLVLAGIDPVLAAAPRRPGRAIDVGSGLEVQLALPGDVGTAEATAAAVERGATRSRSSETARFTPWRVEALPSSVSLPELQIPEGMVALGVGGDDCRVLGFTPDDAERRILVAGAPRAGTSNALALVVAQLVRAGRHVAVVTPRRPPLGRWADSPELSSFGPHDVDALVERCQGHPELCVVVDDADQLEGSPIERALVEYAQLVHETRGLVIAGTDLARANASFRGLVPEVARDGIGLVLGPRSPTDGDVLGVRLATGGARGPGRGFLVSGGRCIPTQVARAEPPTAM